tara:strand:- start:917 stop:1153 length:237 start_codon:yes stop_codon:yes gene_type:complete
MSKISFEEFALKFAEELEIEGDDYLETPLDEIPEFDSMGKITASLVIESLFEFEIDYDVLDEEKSIKSLYEYCMNKSK